MRIVIVYTLIVRPSNAGTIPRGSSASRSAWKLSCVRCVRYVLSAPTAWATRTASGMLKCVGWYVRKRALSTSTRTPSSADTTSSEMIFASVM